MYMYTEKSLIQAAINNENELFIKIFYKPYINVIYNNCEIMLHLCENGNVELVKMVLDDKRINPMVSDGYPLGKACQFGHIEIVKLLLADSRVQPNTCYEEPIRMAAMYNHPEIVKILLEDGRVNPFFNGNMAISNMISERYSRTINYDIIKMLFDYKKEKLIKNSNDIIYYSSMIASDLFDLFKFVLSIDWDYAIKLTNKIIKLCLQYKRSIFIKYLISNNFIKINNLNKDDILRFKEMKILPDYTPRKKIIS